MKFGMTRPLRRLNAAAGTATLNTIIMKTILLAAIVAFSAVACDKKTVVTTPGERSVTVETPSSSKLKVKGDWNTAKGKLKQKYAELTDDDLLYVEGKEDELYGRLQKRLGKSREEVEKILETE